MMSLSHLPAPGRTSDSDPDHRDRRIESLKEELRLAEADRERLEKDLLRAQVRGDLLEKRLEQVSAALASSQAEVATLQQRNKELENPKGVVHYEAASWRSKVILCLRKWKRPLRLREIVSELQMMETLCDSNAVPQHSLVSVVLAKAVKEGALHIEKRRGTRGAYYALPEWLNESGELYARMKKDLL